jgi:hypothetical protein
VSSWYDSVLSNGANIGGLAGLGFGIYDRIEGKKQSDRDYNFMQDQFNYQKGIDERNFGLQQDKLNYDKALQQTMFDREDNSIQRRVADMKAAGINPVLAAGSGAGAGAVVSTTAPYRDNNAMGAAEAMVDIKHKHRMQKLAEREMVMNTLKMASDIAYTQEDVKRVKMNTEAGYHGMDIQERQVDIAISRLDLDTNDYFRRLDHDQQSIQIDQARVAIQREQVRIDRILKQHQANEIDARTAKIELETLGVPEIIAGHIIDNKIKSYDLEMSVSSGRRYKDNVGDMWSLGSNLGRMFNSGNKMPSVPRRGKGAGQYQR